MPAVALEAAELALDWAPLAASLALEEMLLAADSPDSEADETAEPADSVAEEAPDEAEPPAEEAAPSAEEMAEASWLLLVESCWNHGELTVRVVSLSETEVRNPVIVVPSSTLVKSPRAAAPPAPTPAAMAEETAPAS